MRALPALLLAACSGPIDAGDVRIDPADPRTTDDLVAVLTQAPTAASGDEVAVTFSWERDGSVLDDLTADTVPAARTARGERWRVVVTPVDGRLDGEPATAEVVIADAPPSLTLSLGPTDPDTTDPLVAAATATDPDGDPVTIAWAWTADGVERPMFDGPELPAEATSRGQIWEVRATPTANGLTGERQTASVTIANALPAVSDGALTPAEPVTTTPIVATYATSDADGDVVAVTFAWTRDGEPVDNPGASLPAARFSKGDSVAVTLTPTDGQDEGAPVALGPVIIANSPPRPPTIDIPSADPTVPMVCAITVPAVDDDRDALTYTFAWTREGAAYTGATTRTTYAGDTIPTSALVAGEEWTCSVVASDGEDDSAPATTTAEIRSGNVTFREGYYWVKATTNAPRTDHARVCAEHGLTATARVVTITWNAALLARLAEDFGYESVGDVNDSAPSMFCWDTGSSYGPGTYAGACETHNFGSTYDNYGRWGDYPNQRPVFTCR